MEYFDCFRHALIDSYLKIMKKPRHRAGSHAVEARKRLQKGKRISERVLYTQQSEGQESVMLVRNGEMHCF